MGGAQQLASRTGSRAYEVRGRGSGRGSAVSSRTGSRAYEVRGRGSGWGL